MNLFTDSLGFFCEVAQESQSFTRADPGEQGCGEVLQVFVWEVSPHLEGKLENICIRMSFGFLSTLHWCLVRDAVPAQLLLLQVGPSLQVGSSDPEEDMQEVPAQVLLWEG